MRGYYIFGESGYSENLQKSNIVDDVYFGEYEKGNGGTSGEMKLEWEKLNGELVPSLRVYNDAWQVLCNFADVIKALAKKNGKNITVKEFTAILDGLGFTDLTQRERGEK